MPLYDTECKNCGVKETRMIPLSQLDNPIICNTCNGSMIRLISAPMVKGDLGSYTCPITGKWIDGRKAHQENLKRHGCRVLEKGESEAAKKYKAKVDEQLDKSIEGTVEKFIATAPPEKVERLAREVMSGADVTVNRGI